MRMNDSDAGKRLGSKESRIVSNLFARHRAPIDASPPLRDRARSALRHPRRPSVRIPPVWKPCAKTPPRTASTPLPAAARTATGAIRTLGSHPATAPVVLHPGDAISTARRVVYIILLGALTALGPFTIDLYLPAFPTLQADFRTSAAAIQLTLTGTMVGFALGQLIVGPLSDKVGRRVPLLAVTALHVVASAAAARPDLTLLAIARVFMGVGAAAGGVVAMAIVRDLFGGRRLVVMLSRLALVSGAAPSSRRSSAPLCCRSCRGVASSWSWRSTVR
jgi:DHA1 family bicyclomycin/chloramphenicol resistance-like MFS transporter